MPLREEPRGGYISTHNSRVRYAKLTAPTHRAFLPKRQENSIIFRHGYHQVGDAGIIFSQRRRKQVEDLLLLISLLTGRNVVLHSLRYAWQFPVLASKNLELIVKDAEELGEMLREALQSLKDPNWCKKFDNGFHLRMLYNNSDLTNTESRFLAHFVTWEWLYAHLTGQESENLREIISCILNHFWPTKINNTVFNKKTHNIFHVLRNQLAHSGELPIDRKYAEPWMKALSTDDILKSYLPLFGKITQVVILKTLGLKPESGIPGFSQELDSILQTGRL